MKLVPIDNHFSAVDKVFLPWQGAYKVAKEYEDAAKKLDAEGKTTGIKEVQIVYGYASLQVDTATPFDINSVFYGDPNFWAPGFRIKGDPTDREKFIGELTKIFGSPTLKKSHGVNSAVVSFVKFRPGNGSPEFTPEEKLQLKLSLKSPIDKELLADRLKIVHEKLGGLVRREVKELDDIVKKLWPMHWPWFEHRILGNEG